MPLKRTFELRLPVLITREREREGERESLSSISNLNSSRAGSCLKRADFLCSSFEIRLSLETAPRLRDLALVLTAPCWLCKNYRQIRPQMTEFAGLARKLLERFLGWKKFF